MSGLGFFSLIGPLPVPITLLVGKDGFDIELLWSGQEEKFIVYRSPLASDLVDEARIFDETGHCFTTDNGPGFGNDLFFYTVLPKPTDEIP